MRKFSRCTKSLTIPSFTLPLLVVVISVSACQELEPPPEAQGGNGGQAGASAEVSGRAGMAGASSLGAAGLSSGGSGSGGRAGAGGDGGSSSGNAGQPAAGAGGSSAGQAGAAGGGSACKSVTDGPVHAWLFPEVAAPKTNVIHPFLALTTTGPDLVVNTLKLRYYFSADGAENWDKLECYWVTLDGVEGTGLCDKTDIKIVPLKPPRAQADHYLEVSFARMSDGVVLSKGQLPVFEARSGFSRPGTPMDQNNDFSFLSPMTGTMKVDNRDYKETSRVAVYSNDDTLIWGTEPCN